MSISLYVAKADGDREMQEDVTAEAACEAFEKTDWQHELAAAKEAEDAGRETFLPELGLAAEDPLRTLTISPVDSDSVSFQAWLEDKGAGVEKLPKAEVANLIAHYFSGGDDAISALADQYTVVPEITMHELSEADFHGTIIEPMRRLSDSAQLPYVHVRDYVAKCINIFSLPSSIDAIELVEIYLSGDKQYSHMLFNYSEPYTALVIVVRFDADNGNSLVGHHFVGFSELSYRS